MSSSTIATWSHLCARQTGRPFQQLQAANLGSNIFAVSAFYASATRPSRTLSFSPLTRHQVLSFAVAAVYGGVCLRRWVMRGARKAWPRLGWLFGGLCFSGMFGAVAWGAAMQSNSLQYAANEASTTPQQSYLLVASSNQWLVLFSIFYGGELLFHFVSMLILLERLATDASHNMFDDSLQRRVLTFSFKATVVVLVICGLISMAAYIAASVFENDAAGLLVRTAAACNSEGQHTNASNVLRTESSHALDKARMADSVQNVAEAVGMFIIALAYLLFVPFCIRRYRRAVTAALDNFGAVARLEEMDDKNASGSGSNSMKLSVIIEDLVSTAKERQERLLVACVIVLIAFPARAAFDLLQAYSSIKSPQNFACGPCGTCQTEPYLVQLWLSYTPEFEPLTVALSSPLPVTLSVFIITTTNARASKLASELLRLRMGT